MKGRLWKGIRIFGTVTLSLVIAFLLWVYTSTYHPDTTMPVAVKCNGNPPEIKPGTSVKVLSWNVQYMAGKNYVFFYDILDGSGPDERPSRKDIEATYREVVRVIRDENPDVILIQELDDGAARTDDEDQVERLASMLPSGYDCHTSAFYWKASFVPHPRIMGSAGMRLGIFSKYKINSAIRHQLPLIPDNVLVQQFNFKRAILEARIARQGGGEIAMLDTHLDAVSQGSNTMEMQIREVLRILDSLTDKKIPWIIGGDFNLLPVRKEYDRLPPAQKAYFNPESEIKPLIGKYRSIPGVSDIQGPHMEEWFTHFPNDPSVKKPDRTIDYYFLSPDVKLVEKKVRQKDATHISDHMPVIGRFIFP